MSENWGISHTDPEKSGKSYTFCWKNGANIYLAELEKGAIPCYAVNRKLPLHPYEIKHNLQF